MSNQPPWYPGNMPQYPQQTRKFPPSQDPQRPQNLAQSPYSAINQNLGLQQSFQGDANGILSVHHGQHPKHQGQFQSQQTCMGNPIPQTPTNPPPASFESQQVLHSVQQVTVQHRMAQTPNLNGNQCMTPRNHPMLHQDPSFNPHHIQSLQPAQRSMNHHGGLLPSLMEDGNNACIPPPNRQLRGTKYEFQTAFQPEHASRPALPRRHAEKEAVPKATEATQYAVRVNPIKRPKWSLYPSRKRAKIISEDVRNKETPQMTRGEALGTGSATIKQEQPEKTLNIKRPDSASRIQGTSRTSLKIEHQQESMPMSVANNTITQSPASRLGATEDLTSNSPHPRETIQPTRASPFEMPTKHETQPTDKGKQPEEEEQEAAQNIAQQNVQQNPEEELEQPQPLAESQVPLAEQIELPRLKEPPMPLPEEAVLPATNYATLADFLNDNPIVAFKFSKTGTLSWTGNDFEAVVISHSWLVIQSNEVMLEFMEFNTAGQNAVAKLQKEWFWGKLMEEWGVEMGVD